MKLSTSYSYCRIMSNFYYLYTLIPNFLKTNKQTNHFYNKRIRMTFKIYRINLSTFRNVGTIQVGYVSCVQLLQLCLTLCDPMDCQALLSIEFPRQEYWSGLPFPPPGDLPDPGIKPRSTSLQVDSLPSEPPGKVGYSQ